MTDTPTFESITITLPLATVMRLGKLANKTHTDREEIARAAIYSHLDRLERTLNSGRIISEAILATIPEEPNT